MARKPRVFVSYSEVDFAAFAQPLLDRMRQFGVDMFIARECLRPGEELSVIARHQRRSDVMLILLTPGWNRSAWCKHELRVFRDTHPRRRIILLRFGNARVPPSLAKQAHVDLTLATDEQLADAITGVLHSIDAASAQRVRRVHGLIGACVLLVVAIVGLAAPPFHFAGNTKAAAKIPVAEIIATVEAVTLAIRDPCDDALRSWPDLRSTPTDEIAAALIQCRPKRALMLHQQAGPWIDRLGNDEAQVAKLVVAATLACNLRFEEARVLRLGANTPDTFLHLAMLVDSMLEKAATTEELDALRTRLEESLQAKPPNQLSPVEGGLIDVLGDGGGGGAVYTGASLDSRSQESAGIDGSDDQRVPSIPLGPAALARKQWDADDWDGARDALSRATDGADRERQRAYRANRQAMDEVHRLDSGR